MRRIAREKAESRRSRQLCIYLHSLHEVFTFRVIRSASKRWPNIRTDWSDARGQSN